MKLIIKSLVIIFILLLSLNFVGNIKATIQSVATSEANISEKAFEIFWPLSAGITSDQPLYFLKQFKETVRGMLIFGGPQKAEYTIMLATKRLLEANKLADSNKSEFVKKTYEEAITDLNQAGELIDAVKKKKEILGESGINIKNQLNNIGKFVPFLMANNNAYQAELENILNAVKQIEEKIK